MNRPLFSPALLGALLLAMALSVPGRPATPRPRASKLPPGLAETLTDRRGLVFAQAGAVRAQSAREGKLGVALCGLGGFSRQSIAPELPGAKHVWFAGVITGDAAKGREWARQSAHGRPSSKRLLHNSQEIICADTLQLAVLRACSLTLGVMWP